MSISDGRSNGRISVALRRMTCIKDFLTSFGYFPRNAEKKRNVIISFRRDSCFLPTGEIILLQ